jgi:hypothetical protein
MLQKENEILEFHKEISAASPLSRGYLDEIQTHGMGCSSGGPLTWDSPPACIIQYECFIIKVLFHEVCPVNGREDPEGEEIYSSTISSTSALDVGMWSTPCPGRYARHNDRIFII